MQELKQTPIIELRGQELSDYIDQLKAQGLIKNRRSLRGDVLKAYMADLYERRERLNEKERLEKISERRAEPIDDSAFSGLMESLELKRRKVFE